MIPIRFLFYIAAIDGKLGDNVISTVTGLFPRNWGTKGYSHEELWLPNKYGQFSNNIMGRGYYINEFVGTCFSAASRGEKTGVRFAPASQILKHRERWDFAQFYVDPERYMYAVGEMKKEENAPYDFNELLKFVFPFLKDDPKKWICSPVCMWAGMKMGLPIHEYVNVDPRYASKIIKSIGGKIISLRGA